jgi:hypothetical protein
VAADSPAAALAAGRLQVRRLAEDALRAATGPAVATGPELAGALARRDAVSLEVPANATWIGDRLRANVHRIHRAYGLDLTLAWPRLWAILPEPLSLCQPDQALAIMRV